MNNSQISFSKYSNKSSMNENQIK